MAIIFHTQTFTRFTDPAAVQGSEKALVYSADKWAKLIVTLQTVGPVLIGTNASMNVSQPGTGLLLIQNQPTELILPGGDRLYMQSNTVDRLTVVIEPLPWLEQITALLCNLVNVVSK